MRKVHAVVRTLALSALLGTALADDLSLISGNQLVEGTLEYYLQATSTNSSVTEYAVHLVCETPVSGYVSLGDGIIGRFANTADVWLNKNLPGSGTYRLALTLEQPASCTEFTIRSNYFVFSEALPPSDAGDVAVMEQLNALAAELHEMYNGASPMNDARLAEIGASLRTHALRACCDAIARTLLDQVATLQGATAGQKSHLDGAAPAAQPEVAREPVDTTEANIGGRPAGLSDYRLAIFNQLVTNLPRGYQVVEVPASWGPVWNIRSDQQGVRTIEFSFDLAGQAASLMATLDEAGMPIRVFASGALTSGEMAMTGSAASANREGFWDTFRRLREKCMGIEDQRERERCIDQALWDAIVGTVSESTGL